MSKEVKMSSSSCSYGERLIVEQLERISVLLDYLVQEIRNLKIQNR